MKFKITNSKLYDYFFIEGETVKECVKKNTYEIERRGWKRKDCFSEEIK